MVMVSTSSAVGEADACGLKTRAALGAKQTCHAVAMSQGLDAATGWCGQFGRTSHVVRVVLYTVDM